MNDDIKEMDYKSRIEKAVEYIKEHTTSFGDVFIPASESWYLSDTLNGRSDKEMTLKQLLDLYNFRNYREDLKFDRNKYDTVNIRIYLNDSISNNDYVEFGVYDYSEDEYKEDLYKKFIRKEILETKIQGIYFDYDLETFCVALEKVE